VPPHRIGTGRDLDFSNRAMSAAGEFPASKDSVNSRISINDAARLALG